MRIFNASEALNKLHGHDKTQLHHAEWQFVVRDIDQNTAEVTEMTSIACAKIILALDIFDAYLGDSSLKSARSTRT
jgi:hypothetical protein